MRINVLKCVLLLLMLTAVLPTDAQKLITYEAGMGTRDPNDADTWILYQRVRAEHDGMVLYADSALLNQVRNDLTAFGNVKIKITDTTTIYGDQLFYDGESRVLDIWDDTVRLVDGKTVLKSDHLTYDRFASIASYDSWGITVNKDKRLVSDIGYYNSETKVFDIYQNVVLTDTVNEIISTSRYAETRQQEHTSLVTDSALVRMVNRDEDDTLTVPDTIYLHADSIWVVNDSSRQFHSLRAYNHVKIFRTDAQAMSDSAYYSAPDSLLQLFKSPVIWYEHYQSTADTIVVKFDSAGAKQAWLNGSPFCIEQVDPEKFNQVKGRNMVVYFNEGEPDYADILGNAEMVYYIIDEDMQGHKSLVGVNVGVGSDMRIYFLDRAPDRVVTYGKPDMHTYPFDKLSSEKRTLSNFQWYEDRRPKCPKDVFVW